MIINKSILDLDIGALSRYLGEKLLIFGNIPYHITSPILFQILENYQYIDAIALLTQKEVALRLTASPRTKDYGIPTVLLGNYFDISILFDVPPKAFKPAPAVDSSFFTMIPREKPIYSGNHDLFAKIVRAAFAQRRKMIRKSLKEFINDRADVPFLTARPEELTIEDFGILTDALSK